MSDSKKIAASKRKFKPRAPVTVVPRMISQLNCEGVVGLNPSRFLEVIARLRVPVVHVGQLRLVALDVLVEALERTGESAQPDIAHESRGSEADQPASADAVLAMFGRRRVGGVK